MCDSRDALIFLLIFSGSNRLTIDVDSEDSVRSGADIVHIGLFGGPMQTSFFKHPQHFPG